MRRAEDRERRRKLAGRGGRRYRDTCPYQLHPHRYKGEQAKALAPTNNTIGAGKMETGQDTMEEGPRQKNKHEMHRGNLRRGTRIPGIGGEP